MQRLLNSWPEGFGDRTVHESVSSIQEGAFFQ